MARQLAVAIGVSTVRGLPFLAGVGPGVEDFERWAVEQGFEVKRCDDGNGTKEVSAHEVFGIVRDAVLAGDVERLFVFFSGHGFAPGVGDDLWLCTNADSDPADAVNVAKSVALARSCGVGHVAFFADACRTPKTVAFNGLVGRPVFPLDRVGNSRTAVDQFYATRSGDEAFDADPQSGERAFGIFSKFLLGALRGQQQSILDPVSNGQAPRALLSQRLARYLDETVPIESSRAIHISQTPDCIPTSMWEPHAIAWFPGVPSSDAESPDPGSLPGLVPDDQGYTRRRPSGEQAKRIDSMADAFMAHPGRGHFETGVGASIIGAELRHVWMPQGDQGVFREDGNWQVRGAPGQATSMITEVSKDGQTSLWVATALFPGFVTTVTVGDEGAAHVATISVSGDIDSDRATLARADAAFRGGDLGFVDDDDVRRLVSEANPTMAVLSAYAFDRAGREMEVRRVFDQFGVVGWPIPFDVALLAGVLPTTVANIAPGYPMMTRGWALADEIPAGEKWLRYGLLRLSRTSWTTFTELNRNAVDALVAPVNGEVLA